MGSSYSCAPTGDGDKEKEYEGRSKDTPGEVQTDGASPVEEVTEADFAASASPKDTSPDTAADEASPATLPETTDAAVAGTRNSVSQKKKHLPKTKEDYAALTESKFHKMSTNSKEKLINHVVKRLQRNDPEIQQLTLAHYEKGKLLPLAKALESNTHLKFLSVRCCSIDDETAMAFAQSLRTNQTLQFLNLSENNITDDGATELCKALEGNKSLVILHLERNQLKQPGGQAVAQLLTVNSTLRGVNLAHNEIKDCAEQFLRVLLRNNLRQLKLNGNQISDECCQKFADIVKVSTTLEFLSLSQVTIPVALLRGPPSTALPPPLVPQSYLPTSASPSSISTSPATLPTASSSAIASPSMGTLFPFPEVEYATTLDMTKKRDSFTTADIYIIASLLPYNTRLVSLDLQGHPIDRKGVFALAKVLREYPSDSTERPRVVNTTLQQIRVGNAEGWIPLHRFRPRHEADASLDLHVAGEDAPAKFDQRATLFIAAMLKYNSVVTSLNLRGNDVGPEGVAFGRSLLTNNTLKYLDLSRTNLTPEAITSLIYCLKVPIHPRVLGLSEVSTLEHYQVGGVKVLLHDNTNHYRTLRKIHSLVEAPPVKPNFTFGAFLFILFYPLLLPFLVFGGLFSYIYSPLHKTIAEIEKDQALQGGAAYHHAVTPFLTPQQLKAHPKTYLPRGFYIKLVTSLNMYFEFSLLVIALGYYLLWWPWIMSILVLHHSTSEPVAAGCILSIYSMLVVASFYAAILSTRDKDQSSVEYPSTYIRWSGGNFLVALSLFLDLLQYNSLALAYGVYSDARFTNLDYISFNIPFHHWYEFYTMFYVAVGVVVPFLAISAFLHLLAWKDLRWFLTYLPKFEHVMFFFGHVLYFSIVILLVRFTNCNYSETPNGREAVLHLLPSVPCWTGEHQYYSAAALTLLSLYVLCANFFGGLFYDNLSSSLDLQWNPSQQIFERSMKIIYAVLIIFCKDTYFRFIGAGLAIFVLVVLFAAALYHPPTNSVMRLCKMFVYAFSGWTCAVTLAGLFMHDPTGDDFTYISVLIGWALFLVMFFVFLTVSKPVIARQTNRSLTKMTTKQVLNEYVAEDLLDHEDVKSHSAQRYEASPTSYDQASPSPSSPYTPAGDIELQDTHIHAVTVFDDDLEEAVEIKAS